MPTTTRAPAPSTQTSTTTQEVAPRPDAAAQWAATIDALRAYQAECEALDDPRPPGERTYDEDREISRRAHEVERALDDLARECRRLEREAAANPLKKR